MTAEFVGSSCGVAARETFAGVVAWAGPSRFEVVVAGVGGDAGARGARGGAGVPALVLEFGPWWQVLSLLLVLDGLLRVAGANGPNDIISKSFVPHDAAAAWAGCGCCGCCCCAFSAPLAIGGGAAGGRQSLMILGMCRRLLLGVWVPHRGGRQAVL